MIPPAAVPVVSFAVAAASIPVLSRLALKRRWVDAPGDTLKVHARAVPDVGGMAMALACILALTLATRGSSGLTSGAAALLAPAVAMGLVGFVDDRRSLSPAVRLAAGAAAGGLLVILVRITGVPPDQGSLGLALVVGTAYVVGATNAVNMQDGLDGLAGGLVLLSSAGLAAAAAALDQPLVFLAALSVCGAAAGFLVFNWPPASVFMGDSGSHFLGFLVGSMALLLAVAGGGLRHLAGSVLLVGLPVVEAAATVARRLARGRSPFAGDRGHLYDRLAEKGLSVLAVDLVCFGIQALMVGAGVLLLAP